MKKVLLYGIIALVVALAVGIGGVLTVANAQATNNEAYNKVNIAPLSFEMGARLKWRQCWLPRMFEVSPEYNQTVMRVLTSNTETKGLLDQGYKVVSIRPIVKAYVQGDGTIVFKAGQALVVLSNGNTTVTYLIDIGSGTVTHIATINVSALKELGAFRFRGMKR